MVSRRQALSVVPWCQTAKLCQQVTVFVLEAEFVAGVKKLAVAVGETVIVRVFDRRRDIPVIPRLAIEACHGIAFCRRPLQARRPTPEFQTRPHRSAGSRWIHPPPHRNP